MLPQNIKNYVKLAIHNRKKDFVPIEDHVVVSWPVFDEKELENSIEAVLSCRWASWEWNQKFEILLWEYIGLKHIITTTSWSSANLLAFTALTAKELKERRIMPGDEVITVAAWFPTTINPIIQNKATPVFVDVELENYEISVDEVRKALSPKTKAIMVAHTMWNAFNLKEIRNICDEHNLWLIEDNCDALGTTYDGKLTGTFGDISTLSFYPAHHITMWEGGAVMTNNNLLAKVIRSYRDWGRDCWCEPWVDDTCNARFKWKLGELPEWFDHKYIYSRIWYNLKITEMQAAIWVAQIEKLPSLVQARKDNWNYLTKRFKEEMLEEYFMLPSATEFSDPSWFWYLLSLKENCEFSRQEIIKYLSSEKNIGVRLLFAGNYLKHPAFIDYVDEYRVVWDLKNTNYILENTFWVGVTPMLKKDHLDHIVDSIVEFCQKY